MMMMRSNNYDDGGSDPNCDDNGDGGGDGPL